MTNPTIWPVRQLKTQISLAPTQSDQSSLFAQWIAKDLMFLHADSEDSNQTGRMPRLIRVFAGRTGHFVGFVLLWLKCTYIQKQSSLQQNLESADRNLIPSNRRNILYYHQADNNNDPYSCPYKV